MSRIPATSLKSAIASETHCKLKSNVRSQNPSCNLICSKDESYLYEKATAAWKSTKQSHPRCEKHGKLAKMRVVKNLLKSNYGRPFFVCSDQANPCSFWAWGDVQAVAKPKCRHGSLFLLGLGRCTSRSKTKMPPWSPSVIRKVKKETVNKDRLFFCCAQEDSCNYFEWVPEEKEPKQDDKGKEQYPAENFISASDLADLKGSLFVRSSYF